MEGIEALAASPGLQTRLGSMITPLFFARAVGVSVAWGSVRGGWRAGVGRSLFCGKTLVNETSVFSAAVIGVDVLATRT